MDLDEQYEALLVEYEIVCKERETIKRDKDILNTEIRKLGADLVETKTTHKQIEDQHKNQVEELKRQLEILKEDVIESGKQRESDKIESHSAYYRIQCDNQSLIGIIREHGQTIKQFKEIAGKINKLEQQEATIIKLKQEIKEKEIISEQKALQVMAKESQKNELNTMIVQLQGNVEVSEKQLNIHLSKLKNIQIERDDLKAELKQKEIQLNSLHNEVGDITRKLKNEISLESVKVQNGKTRILELEHTVRQLQNELEYVTRVKEELKDRQLLVTQEKTNLERRMEELVNKYENLSTINGKII